MISVLVLDGYSDPTLCSNGSVLSEATDIYIPLLVGVLRYNGILCEVTKPSRLERQYNISGRANENLVYVPHFSCCEEKGADISFIYTDSTSLASTAFRVASKLRKSREEAFQKVIFINSLNENSDLKNYTPVVVDNIRFLSTAVVCDITEKLYKYAVSTAESIAEHYGVIFRDPSTV